MLCMAMAATMLAGCGGNAGTASAGTDSSKKTAGGKEEVVIWDYFETDAQKNMMQDIIDGFNESQEEYEASHVYVPFADYEKQLTLGMASGELPDLVILDGCSMASFIQMDLFGDVSDADIKWDEYLEGPMESTMADGKHYGIPFATNCTALFYNKDIFDAAGMEYPNENTTWEDFHEMAKALTKDGVVGFGNAATGTDEGTFQCLQWLYTAGGDYQNVKGGTDAYYGVTVLPKKDAESDQATSILGGENMGAVKQDDMGGATAFMEYYDKTEVMVDAMKQYGSFPPKTEAAQDSYWTDDPIQKEFITQLQTSIPRGPSASWPEYSDALQTGFQEVMTSAKTPEKAAEDTQAAVDKVKASEK